MRYLRTLRLFWSTSLAAEMEYRANFTLAALTSLGSLTGGLFTLDLFYRNGANLGGWSREEALIVFALFTLLTGFSSVILSPNLSRIVEHVHRGTLDFVLLKPVDSQFWVSLRNASPWGLPDILLGLGLLIYAGVATDAPPVAMLMGVVPVLLALVVLYSLWFVFGSLAIWYVKIWNVTEVLRGLLEAGRFPIAAFPAGVRVFFTVVVPVAFLTSVPAELMIGRGSATWLAAEAAIAAGLFLFTRWFWRFALRYYTSASS